MTRERFAQILDTIIDAEREAVATKGEEYTKGNADRLSSFKEVASVSGVSPLQVCMVYMTKHYQSIASYAQKGKVQSNESLQSRVMDLRLYAALFLALAEDEAVKS